MYTVSMVNSVEYNVIKYQPGVYGHSAVVTHYTWLMYKAIVIINGKVKLLLHYLYLLMAHNTVTFDHLAKNSKNW